MRDALPAVHAGLLREGRCPCNSQSPLAELRISRVSKVFRFADGSVCPSPYFVERLEQGGFDGLGLFQLHHDRPDHIYLRIVRNAP
jgi:hypothetical protein